MKKFLSIVIVMALLATQFIFPSFADTSTIKTVSVTAQRDLIEYYDGVWQTDFDENDNEIDIFVYDVTEADLLFEIEMSDGETFNGDMWEVSSYLDAGFVYDSIIPEGENHIGAYEVEISCEYFTEKVEVKIVENPVESFEAVATMELYENWDGRWIECCENGDCEEYFTYFVYQSQPYFTITYKNGDVFEGYDEEIEAQTGYYTLDIDTQAENHWTVGTNKAKISFLGVECEFEVEVAETPIQSIDAQATFPLYENYNGYMKTLITEEGEEKEYFEYYVMDSNPYFTITFKNGEKIEGTAEDIYYVMGDDFQIVEDQYLNPWKVGENTATMVYFGYEFSFSVEVIKDNVVSVTGEPMTYLIENYSGFLQDYIDENGEVTQFFWYDIYDAEPMFTITYEDGSTFTGTDEEVYSQTGVWTYDETEQSEKPWKLGENTAKMSYLGHEFEVVFEVAESPVESVELTEEDGLYIIIKYKDDETAEKVKAIDYNVQLTDEGFVENIITKTGMLSATVYFSEEEDGITELYINVLGKDSNKLYNCNWIYSSMAANDVAYSSLIYATGCEDLFEKSFTGYNGVDESQDLTQMAALSTYICELFPEEEETYYYHNLETDVVKENIKAVFGVEIEDLTSVDGYNSETGMVEFYEPMESDYEYEVIDMNLVNGQWEKIYKVIQLSTGKSSRMKVVIGEDITVEKIIFRTAGDITGDGAVTAIDARRALQAVALIKELDEAQTLVADANCDGQVSVIDARWILQAAAGTRVI